MIKYILYFIQKKIKYCDNNINDYFKYNDIYFYNCFTDTNQLFNKITYNYDNNSLKIYVEKCSQTKKYFSLG